MERLISDLLDVASIENGTFSLRTAPVDLTSLVSDAMELIESQARERKIDIRREIEHEVPVVMGDSDRLTQALANLLSNAVKFTPQGGNVRVRVAASGDEVVVSVADTGVGISPTDLPHVFDRFWRGRDTATKGAGLGLSIACGIIEAHGGRISAESELGVGTTMTLALPVPGSNPPSPLPRSRA
jgi:signal transduction histidine kinase